MTSKGNKVQLHADVRSEFTRAARRMVRQNGSVPGVVYGAGSESIPVAVNLKEASKLFYTGRSEVFDLNLSGSDTLPVLIKDIQQRGGKVVHVDFLHISMNKPVKVTVPVDYQGTAAGTKSGGILQTLITELEVEGLPGDLPAVIEADISALEVGDKLTVADLKVPSGVTLMSSEEDILASIILPRAVEAAETSETEGAEEEEAAEAVGSE